MSAAHKHRLGFFPSNKVCVRSYGTGSRHIIRFKLPFAQLMVLFVLFGGSHIISYNRMCVWFITKYFKGFNWLQATVKRLALMLVIKLLYLCIYACCNGKEHKAHLGQARSRVENACFMLFGLNFYSLRGSVWCVVVIKLLVKTRVSCSFYFCDDWLYLWGAAFCSDGLSPKADVTAASESPLKYQIFWYR